MCTYVYIIKKGDRQGQVANFWDFSRSLLFRQVEQPLIHLAIDREFAVGLCAGKETSVNDKLDRQAGLDIDPQFDGNNTLLECD
jgi:hypothetical protein